MDSIDFGYLVNFILNPSFDGLKDFAGAEELIRAYAVADHLSMSRVKNMIVDYLREAVKEKTVGGRLLQLVRDLALPLQFPVVKYLLDETAWRLLYGGHLSDGAILNDERRNIVHGGGWLGDGLMERFSLKMDTIRTFITGWEVYSQESPGSHSQLFEDNNRRWRGMLESIAYWSKKSLTKKGRRMRPASPAYMAGCVYHEHADGDECDWKSRQPAERW